MIQLVKCFVYKDKLIKLGQEARESFESIMNYDYEYNWRKIFELACDANAHENKNQDKAELINTLMKHLQSGIENSRDYKFGRIILKFPRFVFHSLRKIKKFFKRS